MTTTHEVKQTQIRSRQVKMRRWLRDQQKCKKRRGRKPKVIHDETEESAVTTDADPNRTQINERLGIVEPVTSTSGLTARGTPTATYSMAPAPTIAISTAATQSPQ